MSQKSHHSVEKLNDELNPWKTQLDYIFVKTEGCKNLLSNFF